MKIETYPALFDAEALKPTPEKWEENENRGARNADDNCYLCNRAIVSKGAWHVHPESSFDRLIRSDIGTPQDAGPIVIEGETHYEQGWFPVGSTCAKRIPLAYRQKESQ